MKFCSYEDGSRKTAKWPGKVSMSQSGLGAKRARDQRNEGMKSVGFLVAQLLLQIDSREHATWTKLYLH